MKKSGLIAFATLIFASFAALAQQADDGLDDFNIPGVEKSLDELVGPEPEVSFPDAANGPVAKDAVPAKTEQQKAAPEPAPQSVVKVETPVEVPGVEWVRVVPDRRGLKEVSFEVPTSWTQKKGKWTVKKGEIIETGLKVKLQKFKEEDLAEAAKHMPEFSSSKRTINGNIVIVISSKRTIKKRAYTIRMAFYGAPMFTGKKQLMLTFSSDNIKRDAPIFEHIMQTVKSSREPAEAAAPVPKGQTIELVKTAPGEAEGAIRISDGYYKATLPGYKGDVFFAGGIDLNNDGMKEWFVQARETANCYGTKNSCMTFYFGHGPDGKLVDLGYGRLESVAVLNSTTNGYRDLNIDGKLHSFNGSKYNAGKAEEVKKHSLVKAGPASADQQTDDSGIKWRRTGLKTRSLEDATIEIPDTWSLKDDGYMVTKDGKTVTKRGEKIGLAFLVQLERFGEKDIKQMKRDMKGYKEKKIKVNGHLVRFFTGQSAMTGEALDTIFAVFDTPKFGYGKSFGIAFASADMKRDGPIFDHILHSVQFEKPEPVVQGTVPLKPEPVEIGKVGELAGAGTVPGVEWIRVTSANKDLKGMSFDVPKNWPRIGGSDTWTKETGSKIDVHLDMLFLRPKDLESTGAKAHLKKFTSRKSVINGIPMEILTAEIRHDGGVYNENLVFFGEPLSSSQGKITMMFDTSNIKRDGPIFKHILNSVRFAQRSVAKTPESKKYRFEKANYWYKSYKILNNFTSMQECARLCDEDDKCAVASFHDSTATGGYANMCALRGKAESKHTDQVGIYSWVKRRALPEAKPAMPAKHETTPSQTAVAGQDKDLPNRAYFMRNDQYVRYNIALDKSDPGYPKSIDATIWPGVWQDGIDAAVNWGNGKIYFFKGRQYIRFDVATNHSDPGYPRTIDGSSWPGLWGTGVDAAINWGNGKVYFFKGYQYVQFDIAANRSDPGYPRTIDGSNWPGIWGGGVDAALNFGNGKAYFFKHDQYIRYDIAANRPDSGYPRTINSSNWPGLWGSDINAATNWGTVVAGASFAPAVTPVSAPTANNWQTYANPRFGTSIEYPASLFDALPPPENGDGRTFKSRDGQARFLIFGSNNALEQSAKALLGEQLLTVPFETIIEKSVGENGFTLRASGGDKIYVRKSILDSDGVIHAFEMDYPRAQAAIFDPVAMRMLATFSATAQSPKTPVSTGAPSEKVSGQAVELAFWQSISQSSDVADFKAYLALWPNGIFAPLAKNKIKRLNAASSTDTPPAPRAGFQPAPPPRVVKKKVSSGKIHNVRRGSKERKQIMNAARIPISRELGQRVIFLTSIVRSNGRWAYLQAEPRRPNGRKLNWATTPYARDWKNDMMSDIIMVLLRRDGRRWKAVEYIVGPTDVFWIGWADQYGLPRELFSAP